MIKILQLPAQKAGIKKVIVSGILFAIIYLMINGDMVGTGKLLKITNGINILGFSFGYSVRKAYDVFLKMEPDGRNYYLNVILPMDYLFAAAGSFFFYSSISFLLKYIEFTKKIMYCLTLVPIIGMLCDITEKTCIVFMLLNYPAKLSGLCGFSSIATIVKFIFSPMSPVIIAILLSAAAIKKRKTGKSGKQLKNN